jgi:hypothetical protein
VNPIVVRNSAVAKLLKVKAIVLWPFIFYAAKTPGKNLIKHEMKHWEQCLKYWVIGFYLIYLFHYFRNRLKGMSHNSAYFWIPFEVEARGAEYEQF